MDQKVKVVLIGDESVGKTSLINIWVNGVFTGNSAPTIGGSNQFKEVSINGEIIHLNVWDTAGAERYRSLTPMYIKDSMGVMIVFDINRKETLQNLENWIKFVHEQGDIPILIVGNKNDIESKEKIPFSEAAEYCQKLGFPFFSTSAKTGENVNGAFQWLAKIANEYFITHGKIESNFDTSATETMRRSCC